MSDTHEQYQEVLVSYREWEAILRYLKFRRDALKDAEAARLLRMVEGAE